MILQGVRLALFHTWWWAEAEAAAKPRAGDLLIAPFPSWLMSTHCSPPHPHPCSAPHCRCSRLDVRCWGLARLPQCSNLPVGFHSLLSALAINNSMVSRQKGCRGNCGAGFWKLVSMAMFTCRSKSDTVLRPYLLLATSSRPNVRNACGDGTHEMHVVFHSGEGVIQSDRIPLLQHDQKRLRPIVTEVGICHELLDYICFILLKNNFRHDNNNRQRCIVRQR